MSLLTPDLLQYNLGLSRKYKVQPGRLGLVMGGWLSGVFFAGLSGRILSTKGDDESSLYILSLLLAICWPLAYFPFSHYRFIPLRPSIASGTAMSVFLVFSLLSVLFSPDTIQSTAYVVLTLVGGWICLQFISGIDRLHLETAFKIYSLLMTIMLLTFTAWDYVPGLRLGVGRDVLNPNSIAMIAISPLLAGMAYRTLLFRYSIVSALFVVIYLTGSRASALSSVMGLLIIGTLRTSVGSLKTKVMVLLGVLFVTGLIISVADSLMPKIEDFLAIHNKSRGVESGGSGRLSVWKETWELFLDHPVFGVGFRAHEKLLKIGTSAHNGYLAMLAEIGIVGFLAVIYLIVSGILGLWMILRKEREMVYAYSILFSLCLSYLFLAMFERFLINMGNPTSLLFVIGVLMSSPKSKHSVIKASGLGV